jgi:hypothetical protein
VRLDGTLDEWPPRARADVLAHGEAVAGFSFATGLRYDASSVYVAGEVTTSTFQRTPAYGDGEDHASLVLAFGVGTASAVAYEVGLFAGRPGESSGQVRFVRGGRGAVPGARIVEAPTTGGYAFEASIPWASFPEALTVRVGLRGAVRYQVGRTHVVATGPGDAGHPGALPPLLTDPEQSLDEGFLAEHDLRGKAAAFDLLADVSGDGMKERIQVWDRFLTVLGPGYHGGRDYYFRDLGGPVVRVEARALTGRGKDDLVVVRRVSEAGGDLTRDWFEVLSFLAEEPTRTFAHEIAVVRGENRIDNAVHAGPSEIEVSPVATRAPSAWDAASYHELPAVGVSPILLPWGNVKTETFRFDGATFAKTHEALRAVK